MRREIEVGKRGRGVHWKKEKNCDGSARDEDGKEGSRKGDR